MNRAHARALMALARAHGTDSAEAEALRRHAAEIDHPTPRRTLRLNYGARA